MDDPTWGAVLVHGIPFDVDRGIGAAARRRPLRGGEAFVAMRPSTFLGLATRLREPRPSLEWLRTQIAEGNFLPLIRT